MRRRFYELYPVKYGKLESVDGLNFSLRDDHPQTLRVLSGDRPDALTVRIGGTMWNIPQWKGKIYPNKTPVKSFPQVYGQHFGTLELNATHYRIHPPETLKKWADYVDDDFRFCPKFPQLITHFRRFNNCTGLTDEFIAALLALEHKLGPSFIQLPPNFGLKSADILVEYLAQWPRELPLAVEFRHPDWFTAAPSAERVWQAMEELGIGAVISDTAGRRDAVHMRCTAPFLVLRFGGNDLHPSDSERIKTWVNRISDWHQGGLREVYFLIHQPDSVQTPETALLFGFALNARMGVVVKTPQLLTSRELF